MSPAGRISPRTSAVIRCWLFLWLISAPATAQDLTGEQVRSAMESAIRYLRNTQGANGAWADYGQAGGSTALATLALLNAGLPPDRDFMEQALKAVKTIPLEQTYAISLKILALTAADPRRYRTEIEQAANWLIAAQHENGMWGYRKEVSRPDFSNTQFALLGLHEAAQAGVKVPDRLWRRAESIYLQAQLRDGSWGYLVDPGQTGTGSMTAAAIASLYITGNSLAQRVEEGFNELGRAPRCGKYAQHRPIARGLAWLADNYRADINPGGRTWYLYYLYAVERVGMISGLRFFGKHDWYRSAAARLVRAQQADGSWREVNQIVDTSFALLFLAKGHRPLLIQKLRWSDDQRWNQDRNDLAHLTAFLGDKLGERVSWEVAGLDEGVQEWLRSPILYFNGHEFPLFNDKAVAQLRDYVHQGGTLLAEACCGSDEFRNGFNAFAAKAFPEFELKRLPPGHPVFESLFQLDGTTIDLLAIDLGCRTSVFFSPRDLSCLWEQANVPGKSEAAFRLGANIAAYATGRDPLPDKLDVARIAERQARPDEPAVPARGALHVAQLMHNGDWRPDPKVLSSLADDLRQRFGVDVVRRYEPLSATDPKLRQHPIVYLTGHFSFELKPDEVAALRQHLERGGFLFADACCGRKAFDASFRRLSHELFPDHPLQPLPQSHPIIRGSPGIPLPRIAYREAVLKESPELKTVHLEGVTLADRLVLVYSPYAIGCGLDGHACFNCRGVARDDARNLAANIILYALSY